MRALPGGKHAQFGVVVAQLVVLVLESPQHVFRVAHKLHGRQIVVLQL